MSERSAYSRVYWSIVDDPKFETIYDSDAHLAAWLRLLLIADQAHPASAHLPSNVRKSSVKALAEAGLIDLAGSRYRIHGLDAERGRRRDAATRLRTGRDPDGDQLPPKRGPVGTQTDRTHRAEDEVRRDETRVDEDEPNARAGLPNLDREAMTALEDRTGRVWSQAGERQLTEYDRLVGDHGLAAVCGALDAVREGQTMTARQLIWPAMKLLEPFPSPKLVVYDDRSDEIEAQHKRRLEQTRAETAELRAALEAASPKS